MPYKRWWCDACRQGGSAAMCSSCGQARRFAGWSQSMHEDMSAFRRSTGLHPYAPRTDLAVREILDRLVDCPACEERGFVVAGETESCEDWGWCPLCRGNGKAIDGRFHLAPGAMDDPLHGIHDLGAGPFSSAPSLRTPDGAWRETAGSHLVWQACEWDPDAGWLFHLDEWRQLQATSFALAHARNWAQFRRMAPEGEFDEVLRDHWIQGLGMYEDDPRIVLEAPVDESLLPGIDDALYPGWLDRSYTVAIPDPVMRRLFDREVAWDALESRVFALSRLPEVQAELAPLGYRIVSACRVPMGPGVASRA